MKKFAIILAVLSLLALGQVSKAANLQSDWYVKLSGVSLYGFDGTYETIKSWSFNSALGTVGPFQVTSPDSFWPQRLISVPISTTVPAGTSVLLIGQPLVPVNFPIDSIVFACDTLYDASKMRLELLMHHSDGSNELLWSQTRSGLVQGAPSVYLGGRTLGNDQSLMFRVITVPEHSALIGLLIPVITLTLRMRRRTR